VDAINTAKPCRVACDSGSEFHVLTALDDSVCSKVLKFTDDTELVSVVSNANDIDRLQTDLRNLCGHRIGNFCLMCKIMHIGYNNYKTKYEMNDTFLDEVTEERNLGVIMQSDLKCMSV